MPRPKVDDPIKMLGELLQKAGARVTFDSQRDMTKPCLRCHTESEPRTLVVVGYWTRNSYGGMLAGDPIERPMCARCQEATASSVKEPTWPDPTV